MVINAILQFMDLNQLVNAIHLIVQELVVDITAVLLPDILMFLEQVVLIVIIWAETLTFVVIWEEWEWFALPTVDVI
jgi:hypothetical protein